MTHYQYLICSLVLNIILFSSLVLPKSKKKSKKVQIEDMFKTYTVEQTKEFIINSIKECKDFTTLAKRLDSLQKIAETNIPEPRSKGAG